MVLTEINCGLPLVSLPLSPRPQRRLVHPSTQGARQQGADTAFSAQWMGSPLGCLLRKGPGGTFCGLACLTPTHPDPGMTGAWGLWR